MEKKTIWIISFSDLHRDPRVYRQILWLSKCYHVTTFGFSPSHIDGVRHVPIASATNRSFWNTAKQFVRKCYKALLFFGKRFDAMYWSSPLHQYALSQMKALKETPDYLLANDIHTLPLALEVSQGRKVVIDLHEYAPKEWEDVWLWRAAFQPYIHNLCARYLPQVDASFTVCHGIAQEYARVYGIDPIVLTNAPFFEDLTPQPIEDHRIRLVYHGIAVPSRKCEALIAMMEHLDDRFTLDIVLVAGDRSYIKKLKALSKKNAQIRFLPPQPMHELSRFLNCYDIGIAYIPPQNFNYLHCLPNKFFEYIQARLAVLIGPSPEMAAYIKEYKCGIIADSFKAKEMAKQLSELTCDRLQQLKRSADAAAKMLHAENNKNIFINTILRSLNNSQMSLKSYGS